MTNLDATDIVIATARQFGLRPAQLQHKASPRGELGRLVFRAKCQAMRTLRDAGASLPMIARAMCYRHHQPVLHGLRAWAREHGGPASPAPSSVDWHIFNEEPKP
jgi:hypothetical protein